jgi:hypothetical protein
MRPTLPWISHQTNLRLARELLAQIRACIAAGTFCLSEYFPDYRGRPKASLPIHGVSCSDVFDAFLAHEEARVTLGDLSITTLISHRKILNAVWRSHIGALPGAPFSASSLAHP